MKLNQHGLTLAEILAAMGIIGIGLVGLMVVVPISSFGVQEGNQLSKATFLAEQRLEQTRNAPWTSTPVNDCLGRSNPVTASPTAVDACANGATVLAAGAVTFPDEAQVPNYTNYSRQVRITDCGVAPGCGVAPNNVQHADLRLVTVTVSYTPLTGAGVGTQAKAVTLNLLVSRR